MKTSDLIDPTRYRTMFDVEDEHWWFHGMEQITAHLLDAAAARGELPPRSDCRVLDAGCGTGRNLRFLQRYGAATAYPASSCGAFPKKCRGRVHGAVG